MKKVQKKSGLVRGNKSGFSFLELVAALLILAILATVALPLFTKRQPKEQRKLFVEQMNYVVAEAFQQALLTQLYYKVTYDFDAQKIIASPELPKTHDVKKEISYRTLSLEWPKKYEIQDFYVQGVNEFKDSLGSAHTHNIWFYIVPDGLAQEVIINFFDASDKKDGDNQMQCGLVLNPFTMKFRQYDEFQKP